MSTNIPNILQHVALCDSKNTLKKAGVKHEDAFLIQPTANITREQKAGYSYTVQFKTTFQKAQLVQNAYDPNNPLKGEKPNTILKKIDVVQLLAGTALVTLSFSPPEVGDLPADELADSISESVKLNNNVTKTSTSEQEYAEIITRRATIPDTNPVGQVNRRNGLGWDDGIAFFQKIISEDSVTIPGSIIFAAALQKRRRLFYKDTTLIEEFHEEPVYISPNSDSTGQGIISCEIAQTSDGIWERETVTRTKTHEINLTSP